MNTETVTVANIRRFVDSKYLEIQEIERRISELQMQALKLRQQADNAIFMALDSDNGFRVVSLTTKG